LLCFFFVHDRAPTETYPLPPHVALPILKESLNKLKFYVLMKKNYGRFDKKIIRKKTGLRKNSGKPFFNKTFYFPLTNQSPFF
ncbi:hypothetical protein, partial [Leptospira borgpetersenii]|uniref:hypothetical protein n=1 Tax=Leptospira borgpetersenii TaxID=174 RepID=UPI0027DE2D6C